MDYNDAFAIDDDHFNKRSEDHDSDESKYQLNNYDYYKPNLVHDFYLKYFTSKLLFDTDILELREFLEYHYDYCDNPEKYYSILGLKIIPKVQELIENGESFMSDRGYYNQQELDDGFVESEGVIYNWDFDYPIMLHVVGLKRLQNEFKRRIQIIKGFIDEYRDNISTKPLRWIAGPSQLAIVIRELIDKGYMDADKTRGEINNSLLSRDLFKIFSINDCDSPKSIEIYLSPGNKKHISAKSIFDERGFFIPDAKFT
jgi:hypothetical protein